MGNIQWNIEEVEEPKFNAEKMERFMKKDLFAAKLFQGLKRGTKRSGWKLFSLVASWTILT